jgi:hypothetical protein
MGGEDFSTAWEAAERLTERTLERNAAATMVLIEVMA